jgi:hypothetical protein
MPATQVLSGVGRISRPNGSMLGAVKRLVLNAMRVLPDGLLINLLFLENFKRLPDFRNPRTFNEKVNWRKLYQRDERFIAFSDKIAAKGEVARLVGDRHIIRSLWTGARPEDIPFDELVPPYVIKTSHGCGGHFFVRSVANINRHEIERSLNEQLKRVPGALHREWAYRFIPPRILVEQLLALPDGSSPNDYKFFVYHGVVHFVQVDESRFGRHRMAFLDRDWTKLPFTKANPQISGEIARPEHLDLMIELAETIGREFDFARIDFYDIPSGVFFGEVTLYPAGGFGQFHPDEWDELFGRPWKIEGQGL